MLFPAIGEPVFFARTSERALVVENLLEGMETVVESTAERVAKYLKKMGGQQVGTLHPSIERHMDEGAHLMGCCYRLRLAHVFRPKLIEVSYTEKAHSPEDLRF